MTKTNNSLNIFQGNYDLSTIISTGQIQTPISKYVESYMTSPGQILSTSSVELSGMSVTLPEQGIYEIKANITEDISSITANTSANYSLYNLSFLNPVFIWSTVTYPGGSTEWVIASSSDGTQVVAANRSPGGAFFSINSGVSWTASNSNSIGVISCIACSSNGKNVVIGIGNTLNNSIGYIYNSFNNGLDFSIQTTSGQRNWSGICCSSDGKNIAACVNNGYIYTNTNYGSGTWTQTNSVSASWKSITCSSDGSKLAAVVNNGYIYTNTNYGSGAWITQINGGSRAWSSIHSSSDGSKLAACVSNGYIYTNTNYGSGTWTTQTGAPSGSWKNICISSDGNRLAAGQETGYVYTSIDSGITWLQQTSLGTESWWGIASSSDLTKLFVGTAGNNIHVGSFQYSSVSNTERVGIKLPILTTPILGTNINTNSFSWIYQNNISNSQIKLYGKYNSSITGNWLTKSDSNGYSYIYARLIR